MSSFFSMIGERTSKGFTGAINEIKGVVNKNHRHDEEHEAEADAVRTAINESHRFKSFADVREGNFVKWHVDGEHYFWSVSELISSARECIMIQDWWLTPELYLRRPPAKFPEWRIDRLLKSKAQQGVKVYIIVYKRHPDHVGSGMLLTRAPVDSTRFWSHHEKVVIIDNHYACIGGLDLCFGRWDTHSHPLADCHPTDFSQTLFPGQEYNNARVKDFYEVWKWVNNSVSVLEDIVVHSLTWPPKVHMTLVGPCSDWSHGVLKEHSIQNACLIFGSDIELIQEAEHYIYIENQFFISSTGESPQVQNLIAKALVERIVRAGKEGQRFKVVVLIPEVPGFAGDISTGNDLQNILAATWRTINRGGHSIYADIWACQEKLRQAGFEPRDYIRFYHLRSFDRINAPWPSFINQMEENSGVSFHQAQIALAKQWIGNPEVWSPPKVAIKKPEPTQEGLLVENKEEVNFEEVDFPATVEEAVEIVEKFEAGAIGVREDYQVSDSIAHHALMDSTNLTQEKWLGTEQEELDSYVSEILYIHSKLMIVDDRRVIMGSANLNDRSQKGNGDSEIALVVEDSDLIDSRMNGEPYKVSRFAASLRRKLYREHLGLIQPEPLGVETDFMKPAPTPNPDEFGLPEDTTVADPLSEDLEQLWNKTAQRNRAIFSELFKSVPSDLVHDFEEYKPQNYVPKTRVGHLAPGQSLERVRQRLSEVRGHLVEAPLEFLIKETGIWENAFWMGLNPTAPVYL
ncbi:hypothetical protein M408DRAFT_7620 [Serendipita vermifera MAFF 305830]|uniref:phospholipase D n=1 Tax=Serendipita vermifera MAFF 305830 TaxID=933852 RepID=A0A0C2XNS1_SERVB|nr:hypothetical protein M408DRAFT_7620 [Serendipita vermifera MAFF 305830]